MARSQKGDQAAFGYIVGACAVTLLSGAGLLVLSPQISFWQSQTWLAQAQVFFNVVGAGLAVVAVVYAWRVAEKQFKLADAQGKIIDEQLALQNRQLAILEEHKAIFLRLETSENRQEKFLETQAGIAETQHRIMLEQMARKPDLMLILRSHHSNDVGPVGGVATERVSFFGLAVRNNGQKDAERVAWQIFIKDDPKFRVQQLPQGFAQGAYEYEGQRVFRGNGNLEKPVFAEGTTDLPGVLIVVSEPGMEVSRPVCLWTMNCKDGKFPRSGKNELVLDMVGFKHLLQEEPHP